MKTILVIGIGTGNPEHVTVQAIGAMGRAEVFFVIDKGPASAELVGVREAILARFVRPGYRLVRIEDSERDRAPADYGAAVGDWHAARARRYAAVIAEALGPAGCGAFLVWGDPSLYDSTLRILAAVRDLGVDFRCEVVPGIASPQALAAAHGMVLHGIGEPLRITTGRRLAKEPPRDGESVVVMLDDGNALTAIGDDVDIWWGAYLGMPDEIVMAGRGAAVRAAIAAARAAHRARKGWIMDTCLLRKRSTEAAT